MEAEEFNERKCKIDLLRSIVNNGDAEWNKIVMRGWGHRMSDKAIDEAISNLS